MGKTFAEKVLSLKAGRSVSAGEIVVVEPDYCMSHENASNISQIFQRIGAEKVWAPSKIVIVLDHTVPCSTEAYANSHKMIREFTARQGIENFYDLHLHGGICHQIMSQEGYAAPGRLIIGTDSHTGTAGAVGALAIGIGRSEMAAVWTTGDIWLRVPESIKVVVEGKFQEGVYAKDLILYLLGILKADGASYQCIEYHGSTIENMSIGERMTLCNMGIEMDAKASVCRPDKQVFLQVASRAKKKEYQYLWADEGASYAKEIHIRAEEIVPAVAKPDRVDNYSPVTEVCGTRIDQVFIGSCTNGRLEDLHVAADILEGRQIKVRTIVNPASYEVLHTAVNDGTISTLLEAGCTVSPPGCGPCIGVSGGVLGENEVCISTSNRNFKGRMGSRSASVYLARPATTAYSALCGSIQDPRTFKKGGYV